jgi:hypothetical protein
MVLLPYYVFPQQLPGPAHPASLGEEPQQDVSPWPGIEFFDGPDMEECAERSFVKLELPHSLHFNGSVGLKTSSSLCFPQSSHK